MVERTGSGGYRYEIRRDWAKLPDGWELGQVAIATDRDDNVFLYNRSHHPMIVLDRAGNLVDAWSEDVIRKLVDPVAHCHAWDPSGLRSAHGMFIDNEQNLYFAVLSCHVVLKTDRDGNLLQVFGERDVASNLDWDGRLLQWLDEPPPRAHGPLCLPTDIAVARDGSVYISDGYGNARVHRYSPDGRLIASFGTAGKDGPGQFHLPHSVWVDDDRMLVADRENDRVQVFDLDGRPLAVWTDFVIPCDLYLSDERLLYVAEGAGPAVCTVRDDEGSTLARLTSGDEQRSERRSDRTGGHALWVDSTGSVYLNRNVPGQQLMKYVRV